MLVLHGPSASNQLAATDRPVSQCLLDTNGCDVPSNGARREQSTPIGVGQLEPEATSRARELQNAILLRRRTNPFVFDQTYRRSRRDHEEQTEVGALDMVDRVSTASGSV